MARGDQDYSIGVPTRAWATDKEIDDMLAAQPPQAAAVQQAEKERVCRSIAETVLTFLRERFVTQSKTFYSRELHDYVGHGVAPGSADRILRQLRADGRCKYCVVLRSDSLYEVTHVEP